MAEVPLGLREEMYNQLRQQPNNRMALDALSRVLRLLGWDGWSMGRRVTGKFMFSELCVSAGLHIYIARDENGSRVRWVSIGEDITDPDVFRSTGYVLMAPDGRYFKGSISTRKPESWDRLLTPQKRLARIWRECVQAYRYAEKHTLTGFAVLQTDGCDGILEDGRTRPPGWVATSG